MTDKATEDARPVKPLVVRLVLIVGGLLVLLCGMSVWVRLSTPWVGIVGMVLGFLIVLAGT